MQEENRGPLRCGGFLRSAALIRKGRNAALVRKGRNATLGRSIFAWPERMAEDDGGYKRNKITTDEEPN